MVYISLPSAFSPPVDISHLYQPPSVAFYHLNALQESQNAFVEGLKWEADQPFLWNNLACVWLMAGALEQAEKGLAKAFEAEPNNPVFLYNVQLLQHLANGAHDILEKHKPRVDLFYNRMN